MHSEASEINNSLSFSDKSKKLGIIVLTDNRNPAPAGKVCEKYLKGSACKETQVDSHQFLTGSPSDNDWDDMIASLTKRITYLQEKVEVLQKSKKSEINLEKKSNKKNRRKFQQIVRDNVCSYCQKVYGSDTALKYHLKLKHSSSSSHSQSQ